MANPTPPIGVICFLLLAGCSALGQSEPSSPWLLYGVQFDGSNAPERQLPERNDRNERNKRSAWSSLPDAPSSVRPPTPARQFEMFTNESRSVVTLATKTPRVPAGHWPEFLPAAQAVFIQNGYATSVGENLFPSSLRQNLSFYPSTSRSFLGRASYAASRIFITRDESGKGRLNTPYLLGLMSSVVMQSARRPYWARSTSATFNNFGSTIGGDAGLSLYREFGSGIRQIVKSHTPKFVSGIEARITDRPTRTNAVYTPEK
jgi:hypothetical protein